MWNNPLWKHLIADFTCKHTLAGNIATYLINGARVLGVDCYPQVIHNGPMVELMVFHNTSIAEALESLANFAGCEVVYSPSQDIREPGFGVSFVEKPSPNP